MLTVKPCGEVSKYPLTYAQIKEKDGVYQEQGMEDYRFIVLSSGRWSGYDFVPSVVVFWYSLQSGTIGAVDGHENAKFRLTNEEICMEVRAAQ